MLQQQVLILIVFSCLFCVLHARLCEDVKVMNNISTLKKHLQGCSVIAGNLQIFLIENELSDSFANVSFPELTEIRGSLQMYKVHGLTTLANLFPNLSIIRGLTLFREYSFVLFDLNNLQEIGLSNLKYIIRGSVRIERCPQLCFVNTVNWTLIANDTNQNYFRLEDHDCGLCNASCKGLCWNKLHCQELLPDNCHPECVGCTEPNSPHKCIECKNFSDNGTCVSECPKNKVRHPMLVSCLTHDECSNNVLQGIWSSFEGDCVDRCPPCHNRKQINGSCFCSPTKVCFGTEINNRISSENLTRCTHINGSLSIQIYSKTELDELYENLDCIEEIDEYLMIRRSNVLTSLDFFKKLKIVHGKKIYNNRYALVVFQNQNLNKLWGKNQSVEIKNGTILFHDNFNLCQLEINKFAQEANVNFTDFDVSPHSNGDNKTCKFIELNITVINVNSTNVTFVWENVTATRNLSAPIGYLLTYTQDLSMELTICDEDEECYEHIWESILIVDNTTHQIVNLNPYTEYAYYIKLYTNSSKHEGRTNISYVTTLSDDPSELLDFDATATDSDSVLLQWKHPFFPNGILGHYELVIYYEKDDEKFINQRNYCKHPHKAHKDFSANTSAFIFPSGKFEFTCDRLNIIMNADSKPGVCKNYMYSIGDQDKNVNMSLDFVPVREKPTHKITKRSSFPTELSNIMEVPIEDSNLTSYTVKPLRHFSLFVFVLKVCNKDIKSQCGSPVMTFQRTLPQDDADDIPPGLSTYIENSILFFTWPEPRQPNSMIVSYQIEYKGIDLENSSTVCITRTEFVISNHKLQIKELTPGEYMIRIKSVSLAGPGKFSKFLNFVIPKASPSVSATAMIVGFTIVLISIVLGVLLYYRHKKKHSLDQETLISNQNDDYLGPTYVEDEWEIHREDIEIYKKITQGTFITIHMGCIKSQNLPCIVKSTTKADYHEKIRFLNDTSIMKWSSGAHHVMKLLGIVSKVHQPLVLLELVADGDLKAYLRKLRYLSINMTITERLRMAAEVADGMVYLSSKKFIHRDLAARNCMVSNDRTVKIGDYGISKDIYKEDYYKKENGKLSPIRWMAPESLIDEVFTTDSDVWSYGVLLWEIVTFANRPYETLRNEGVSGFVTSHGTLQRPPDCPDLLWDIMKLCWEWRPNDRPLFTDIVAKLEPHVGQHFSLVSFYHSTEGEEYRSNTKLRLFNAPALSTPFSRDSSVRWNVFDDNIDF